MNFCAACGRQRTGNARFCDDCGTEFAQDGAVAPSAAAQPSGAPPVAEPNRWDPPAEATRWESPPTQSDWASLDATREERQPDATRIDQSGGGRGTPLTPTPPAPPEADPFASWFAADPPGGRAPQRSDSPGGWQPADPWQAADTVYAAPAPNRAAPQPLPPQPPQRPPYGAQQVRPAGGNRSSGGKMAAFIIVVVLVMLAAGGGAYALVSRSNRHNTAGPTTPAVTSSATTTPSRHASASTSASAGTSPTMSPSATASPTASATVSPSAGVVTPNPGIASNPAEPAVETTLTNYFQGINTHNYAEYSSALDPQALAKQTQAEFDAGYKTTSDSGMTLILLQPTTNGGLDATVLFTSHQDPADSVDDSPCNNWTLTFFLVPQGTGYLDGVPPSSYHATHTDC